MAADDSTNILCTKTMPTMLRNTANASIMNSVSQLAAKELLRGPAPVPDGRGCLLMLSAPVPDAHGCRLMLSPPGESCICRMTRLLVLRKLESPVRAVAVVCSGTVPVMGGVLAATTAGVAWSADGYAGVQEEWRVRTMGARGERELHLHRDAFKRATQVGAPRLVRMANRGGAQPLTGQIFAQSSCTLPVHTHRESTRWRNNHFSRRLSSLTT